VHQMCVALVAMIVFNSSEANAVFWRGLSAPTNIDYHGWFIIKEAPPSPCQWIHVTDIMSANVSTDCTTNGATSLSRNYSNGAATSGAIES
jgi:hypothetical protein